MNTFLLAVVLAAGHGYGPVEIVRDAYGVPSVLAETDDGAMYGLGYASAEDRGFQMHLKVRIMQGRLAEIVGNNDAIGSDRKHRTFGWSRAARETLERLDRETVQLLQAYSDGVNAYFSRNEALDHPVFAHYDFTPDTWTPEHCLLAWWHLGQFFATDGTRDLIRFRNREQNPLGTGQFFEDDAAVVQRSDVDDAWLDRVTEFGRRHGMTNVQAGNDANLTFSQAWAIGRDRSTDGSATLVSEPRTPATNPSLLYEFHVKGKTLHGRGVGSPGSPALLIGFTPFMAWGLTALGADQADLFMLETDPERPDQYRLDGAWRSMEVEDEVIRVRGGRDQGIRVRRTVFGPVVTEFCFAAPNEPEVALKRIPLVWSNTDATRASFALMRAQSVGEVRSALADWNFPSANVIWGARTGDIGYQTLFTNPIRSARYGNGDYAMPGRERADDWQGFVPNELLPQVVNPARGFLYSGNHRPVDGFYPLPLGISMGSMGHSFRSWRLAELMATEGKWQPEDLLEMRRDTVNPARRDLARVAMLLHERGVRLSPTTVQRLAGLRDWQAAGSRMDLRVPGVERAQEIDTMFRLMGSPLGTRFGGGESGLTRFLREALATLESDPEAELPTEWVQYVDSALSAAGMARPHRSPELDLATIERRAYDGLDRLGSLFPEWDLRITGLSSLDPSTLLCQPDQAYTQWVPLGDPDGAMALLPPKNTERPHRLGPDNPTLRLWREGGLRPAPLSEPRIRELGVHVQRL